MRAVKLIYLLFIWLINKNKPIRMIKKKQKDQIECFKMIMNMKEMICKTLLCLLLQKLTICGLFMIKRHTLEIHYKGIFQKMSKLPPKFHINSLIFLNWLQEKHNWNACHRNKIFSHISRTTRTRRKIIIKIIHTARKWNCSGMLNAVMISGIRAVYPVSCLHYLRFQLSWTRARTTIHSRKKQSLHHD